MPAVLCGAMVIVPPSTMMWTLGLVMEIPPA
jgi:hypothetical protein